MIEAERAGRTVVPTGGRLEEALVTQAALQAMSAKRAGAITPKPRPSPSARLSSSLASPSTARTARLAASSPARFHASPRRLMPPASR